FAGAILELYAFDAYGNAIGFDPSVALTEFLYSGEQFDSKIGQQYLRQRYYDPVTGRFNRLDPFFGNLNDPQSLHKYLYCHADSINGIDPNGESLFSIFTKVVRLLAGITLKSAAITMSAIVGGGLLIGSGLVPLISLPINRYFFNRDSYTGKGGMDITNHLATVRDKFKIEWNKKNTRPAKSDYTIG
ncbi:MAG: RHS repeat-associated core domain-containing protein, partial [Planctomycetaceae bacterium]|nr:RHS repeat-associated core domain-containing protein [Planctomycetaceae bacterium]